ncbi:unnamed protein product [Gongylonema pulchrum]|uniref:Uncharacterized protein n=1 Tax=Gongylonema pulchrum TaxID=637853 RepID=A0A183EIA1_9BILA|nr:unnamed protein product [Gongylonema pulchrum]
MKTLATNRESCSVNWFSSLRCRVLEHLAEIIQNGPDELVGEIVNIRIAWPALRADVEIRIDFIKNGGFELLSNQMRGYPATEEIASSLFSLLCEESVRFNDDFDANRLAVLHVNHFKCLSLKAIFALWEESVCPSSLAVCENVSSALRKTALMIFPTIFICFCFHCSFDANRLAVLHVNHFKCLALKAIFALWEESVCPSSLAVCENVSSALRKIFADNDMLMQAMMDAGLCLTMVSVLKRIAALPSMYDFIL